MPTLERRHLLRRSLSMFHHSSPFSAVFSWSFTILLWCFTILRRSLLMFHHSPLMLHHSPSMFEVQGNEDFSLCFQFRFSASYHSLSFDFIFVLLISFSFSFSSFDFDFPTFDFNFTVFDFDSDFTTFYFDSDFTTFYFDSLLSISFLYFWFRFRETLLGYISFIFIYFFSIDLLQLNSSFFSFMDFCYDAWKWLGWSC